MTASTATILTAAPQLLHSPPEPRLSKVEPGYHEIQIGTFLRCAAALGVAPAELLRGL